MELRNVRPGEMFSDAGPEFWSAELAETQVPVAVRTNVLLNEEDAKRMVYRIELVNKLKKAIEAERPRFDPTLPPGMRR